MDPPCRRQRKFRDVENETRVATPGAGWICPIKRGSSGARCFADAEAERAFPERYRGRETSRPGVRLPVGIREGNLRHASRVGRRHVPPHLTKPRPCCRTAKILKRAPTSRHGQ